MLVDGNNCIVLLMRNALMGFREPVVLHQPANRFVSLFANNPISIKVCKFEHKTETQKELHIQFVFIPVE